MSSDMHVSHSAFVLKGGELDASTAIDVDETEAALVLLSHFLLLLSS
jgi:hypothetical protein